MDFNKSFILEISSQYTYIEVNQKGSSRNKLISRFRYCSLDSDLDKESFDKILEFLIRNQKVKTSCYANKTCLPIPKENQMNNIRTKDKDKLKEELQQLKKSHDK